MTPSDATATVPRGWYWRVPRPPCVLCFTHLDWPAPLILVALLPSPRRIYFFGPREANMRVGWKNRLMAWVGNDVPFKPDRSRMLETARRVREGLSAGYALAIAGGGGGGEREGEGLPA